MFLLCASGSCGILKQKSHPYEVYNKTYEVIKSHISILDQKVIFSVYVQPNTKRKPLKQSQNTR